MTRPQSRHPDTRDELLALLADGECRTVLEYFRNGNTDEVTIDDLARELATQLHRSERQTAIRLHHCVVPRLEDAGVVEYAHDQNSVRYRGHPALSDLQDAFTGLETRDASDD